MDEKIIAEISEQLKNSGPTYSDFIKKLNDDGWKLIEIRYLWLEKGTWNDTNYAIAITRNNDIIVKKGRTLHSTRKLILDEMLAKYATN